MLEKLMSKLNKNYSEENKRFIVKAYNFAKEAHKDQKRESGEPYIVHPVEVACILADMGLDPNTVASGLLHDVIEDTTYTYKDLKVEFNEEVANLVEGVTKLGKIKYKTKEEMQADNVRKMLLAMTKDIRVILIKLADRLHNMRTLKYVPIEKQKEKAKETFDIYAPLAHRLGISRIKWELEDLGFRYIKTNEYYKLVKQISVKRAEREEYINKIIEELKQGLAKANIKSDIDGRPKHFYSIYRKMIKKNKTIDQIFDLTAIRILVDSIKDCYAALGIVHTMYKPIPGRFKDYIAMPKPNMYQSLHSTVIGPKGKPFEIQIRTYEMHKTAEYGIAAHWKYKEGNCKSGINNGEMKLSWLREMLEWQRETSSPEEFMKEFKIDLFSDEVFVFTPKGMVINLPSKSTPIDFAYRIHTDIGNKCIGAKVNGKMVPLNYKLKTGEIVEVLTSATAKGPNINWLSIVKSNQAKVKIRAWFKKLKREENIARGKDLLEKEAKKQGYNFGEITKGEVEEMALKRYNCHNLDDLYVLAVVGSVSPANIVTKIRENYESRQKINCSCLKTCNLDELKDHIKISKKKNSCDPGVIVKGENNLLVRFSKCCNPILGDKIIGYITKGRGVSVHRKDCKNMQHLSDEDKCRIIEVEWTKKKGKEYIAHIQVKGEDRIGLLSDVMDCISESNTNLYEINAKTAQEPVAIINLKVKIADIEHLKMIMRKIKKLKGVIDVYRIKN